MGRLGGGHCNWADKISPIDHLEVWSETLSDAQAAITYRLAKFPPSDKGAKLTAARAELRSPHKAALATADEHAERMISEAQSLDPRLVRRPSWVRSCEGETACPALLLAGGENAFFARRRTETSEAASGDPVLVTISTDSSEVNAESLAAFIATVKLVQQFRPVYVVWQGGWMREGVNVGFVFHVPLITGDMDFERLAFVINSKRRDSVSFCFMVRHAMEVTKQRWREAGEAATRSYLHGSVDFVNHAGIAPDAESIAVRACKWLGWDAPWLNRWNEKSAGASALCRWQEGEESMRAPYTYTEPTEADRAKWAREARERDAQIEATKQAEIARRLAAVS